MILLNVPQLGVDEKGNERVTNQRLFDGCRFERQVVYSPNLSGAASEPVVFSPESGRSIKWQTLSIDK